MIHHDWWAVLSTSHEPLAKLKLFQQYFTILHHSRGKIQENFKGTLIIGPWIMRGSAMKSPFLSRLIQGCPQIWIRAYQLWDDADKIDAYANDLAADDGHIHLMRNKSPQTGSILALLKSIPSLGQRNEIHGIQLCSMSTLVTVNMLHLTIIWPKEKGSLLGKKAGLKPPMHLKYFAFLFSWAIQCFSLTKTIDNASQHSTASRRMALLPLLIKTSHTTLVILLMPSFL